LGNRLQRRTAPLSLDGALFMHFKIADLRKQRSAAFDAFNLLAQKENLTEPELVDFTGKEATVRSLDDQITRAKAAQELAASTAQPVAGQPTVSASVEKDHYVREKSLVLGGVVKMLGAGGGSIYNARTAAHEAYGESHPVTRALAATTGTSGGFAVPEDYMAEIIPLLRAAAVVRSAGPRVIPMPRGTMRLPGQSSAASATYGSEIQKIPTSQQGFNQIVASYKKLTALVPVSNDMMRYADPAIDAFVRDDLVKIVALREDIAFLTGDGTQDTPKGFLGFANDYVRATAGTIGNWSTSGNSVYAVGGTFITSNMVYTLATVANELGGAINRLDVALVPDNRRVWFMHPRTFNYLNNVQNSLAIYVFRDELSRGTLLGYPFKKTAQLPINIYDSSSTNQDLSFVFLAEMTEAMVLDSMQLELAVSKEGTYIDGGGNTISVFQNDQTLIRAIAEHDFQLRHAAAVAVIQNVRWAPAIS